ncbi:hypothetical protein AVEN_202807-1 [Araneus ventricosus]|uniref:Uncharacterized protein n=1 Tax=Araneus ventricosus TaxID=182803 RepID=A0A4Y2DPE0_ARAVE|nr:hypothetical protein AVEN_202807-1 [Araneus ventricosus]
MVRSITRHRWYMPPDSTFNYETPVVHAARWYFQLRVTGGTHRPMSEVVLHGNFLTVTPVVTNVLAAVRTLDRFGISSRAGAAIVSAALQDVGINSESNVLNVVDRNEIRHGRTKARTTLVSQVIKDYDHDRFVLYLDGRKGRTLSMEDNRRKVIIEEHISLAKEPGSEYIGHVCKFWESANYWKYHIYFVMR